MARRGQEGIPRHAEVPDVEPLRILLAEDNIEMLRLVSGALKKDGYDVIEARSGAELLAHLVDHLLHPVDQPPVDLIISDLRMPGFTGLEVLGGLRAEDWVTPFILITAFGGEEVQHEALRAGAAAVFDKPFDIDDLRSTIATLIGRPRRVER
jgi:CheY-like chemotaxis protein